MTTCSKDLKAPLMQGQSSEQHQFACSVVLVSGPLRFQLHDYQKLTDGTLPWLKAVELMMSVVDLQRHDALLETSR